MQVSHNEHRHSNKRERSLQGIASGYPEFFSGSRNPKHRSMEGDRETRENRPKRKQSSVQMDSQSLALSSSIPSTAMEPWSFRSLASVEQRIELDV